MTHDFRVVFGGEFDFRGLSATKWTQVGGGGTHSVNFPKIFIFENDT